MRALPFVHRRLLVLLLGLVALSLVGVPGMVVEAEPAAARQTTGTGTTTAAKSFGVAMPGVPDDLTGLQALSGSLGRRPDTVMWYVAWSYDSDFPAAGASRVAGTGATPEITWEPWDPAAGATQPSYSLASIASGAHDGYVSRWARQIRSYGKPVVLRFGHEMNGSWYPWAEQANGNRPGDYVAAWRHVVTVFRQAKASNVTWMWSPNVPYTGSTSLAGLYPGDSYVGRVALDGYNWATLQPGSTWQSFWQVFEAGVTQVRALTTRPLYVGEVGCPEDGGDKAGWVDDMFAVLAAHPEIRGFTWFDFDKEADWRIDSSATSLDAFRAGLATY